ncbi:MAG: type I-C CRISPR-associated protein Cas8c/Csd1 [Candidatus Nitricoxidivorans perseverans]|uniref:Type I-C CRISPR-associated protein Cas8c/Csd1 n=1 Tax=Candidatus Nitricoxidivorans perseverans TaxID=2975601 RepID=A0AA49IXH9_9PROT|nr:MAG: type I-C CRISPR-associated protein Cas8c/Csd1 [Candidatus Nitricoxidivorans perseverans]
MAWIEKLFRTYENCADKIEPIGAHLWPVSHVVKRANVEVVLDAEGKFRRARVLGRSESPTLIPTTEKSAGRTGSRDEPHPLCEELGYCAADLPGAKAGRYATYKELLASWSDSPDHGHPKVRAVLAYVSRGSLWSDLDGRSIFPVTTEDAKGRKSKVADEKAFVRWVVEEPGNPCAATWEDKSLIEAWTRFHSGHGWRTDLCMVTGQRERIAQRHSKFIRYPGDGAKLISSNDSDGFTFRGRFTDQKDDYGKQACTVSYEVSQKAHNALRWLIERQAYRDYESGQTVVAWAVGGKAIPDPWSNSLDMVLRYEHLPTVAMPAASTANAGDVGQTFATRFRRVIAGYGGNLDPSDDIVVMGLDSATPGRMAITYYRELKGSEFLERIRRWHEQYAWHQDFGKDRRFVGAPAPRDFAEAAFATRLGTSGELRLDDALRKATVERLLPCIVDGQCVPRDLVLSAVRRASSRVALTPEEWERFLGIACALFRGYSKSKGKEYDMALEQDRNSRDYLYGRLLAVADNIEGKALRQSGEARETMAARLMQRFADRPFSTWRNIELALRPYQGRLRASEISRGFLLDREKRLDEILCRFNADDFTNDSPLTGEFLIGYHCQRRELFAPTQSDANDQSSDD